MPDMEVNLEYKDNRPELKRRLREEYNLPEDDRVIEAILDATVIDVDRGFAEMEPIREKYSDLLCLWCGKLHFRIECQQRSEEYLATKSQGSQPINSSAAVPEGFDPYVVFYDAGSVGLKTELSKLSFEELEAVRIRFTAVTRVMNIVTLVDLIIKDVKDRATRGQEFGDAKLPE